VRSRAPFSLWVSLAILVASAAPAFAQPAPGPFDRRWDWAPNGAVLRRDLKLCIEQNTPAMIAGAARFGATTLSNANLGWKIEEITIFASRSRARGTGACATNWRRMAGSISGCG
jgi:hypothetical protein